jgi:hypothetical protein
VGAVTSVDGGDAGDSGGYTTRYIKKLADGRRSWRASNEAGELGGSRRQLLVSNVTVADMLLIPTPVCMVNRDGLR